MNYHFSKNHRFMGLMAISLIALGFFFYYPIRTTLIRLEIIALTLFLILLVIFKLWKRWNIGKFLLIPIILILLWALVTWQYVPIQKEKYISALINYQNTPYVWGGETKTGIDCSGLIRMGLRDTYLSQFQIGAALRIWFYDSAAHHLSETYQDIFVTIGEFASIKQVNHSNLSIGSLAVTANGVHTLAYLGNKKWIQASPSDGQVTIKSISENDDWFLVPIQIDKLKE